MLKLFFFLLIPLTLGEACYGQNNNNAFLPPPVVDERVELISIVARIAGFEEYSTDDYPLYAHDIHSWFNNYKEHPAVKLMKELREKKGLGYDRIMVMAVYLGRPPALKPLLAFSDSIPEKSWGADSATKFAAALRDFYKITNAQAFFDAHKSLFNKTLNRYNTIYKQLDIGWYRTYYGVLPEGTFNIILGLSIGGANYGPKVVYPGHREDKYAIEGIWQVDSLGMPVFNEQVYLPTLIHEFNHSFVNPLSDKYELSLQNPCSKIFKVVQKEMERQAYQEWKIMFNEALVRAAVIRYLKTHPLPGNTAAQETAEQESEGFYWINGLANLLGTYEQNRDKYKSLKDFMPEIIRYYDSIPPKMDSLKNEYQKHCAFISSTAPLANDTLVDPRLKQIEFTFNKEMIPHRYAFGPTNKGLAHYPVFKSVEMSNDNKTMKTLVELKPGTEYEINVAGRFFRAMDGYQCKNYLLKFKTAL